MITLIKGLFNTNKSTQINTQQIAYADAKDKARVESLRSRNVMIAVFRSESKDTHTVSRTTLGGECIDVAINNFIETGWSIRPIYNQTTIADNTVIAVFYNGKCIK